MSSKELYKQLNLGVLEAKIFKHFLEESFEAGVQFGNDIEMNNQLIDFNTWYKENINE